MPHLPATRSAAGSAKARAHFEYMAAVMERLEWDLHNTIALTDRIPDTWREIAQAPPRSPLEKVTLKLDRDVLRFFRSMGPGYGPRINDVLRSYMHARLAGVIAGAETLPRFRDRGPHDGPKPGFDIEAVEAALITAAEAPWGDTAPAQHPEMGAPEPGEKSAAAARFRELKQRFVARGKWVE
jgi:uncharacterized protein (DUF4415 family)